MAAYFVPWLIPAALGEGIKYFIFFSNWSYLVWCSYLLLSAASSTAKVIAVCCRRWSATNAPRQAILETPKPYIDTDQPVGCCGSRNDKMSWHQKIQWIFFTLGAEQAFAVSILYWTIIYSGYRVTSVNINNHTINSVGSLIDVFFSGISVRILHVIYLLMLASAYAVFSGVYYACSGTNLKGDPYIYNILDYDESPGAATGWVLGIVFVFVPLLHLAMFGLFSVRFWITYYLWRKIEDHDSEEELIPIGGNLKKHEQESVP